MLYYNHQRPLKSLKFKTPWELIQQCYNENREKFREDPNHKIVGLNKHTIIFSKFNTQTASIFYSLKYLKY